MRLFVALDLPGGVRTQLAAWAVRAAPPGVRLVPADNLHVTLAFLGERGDEQATAVGALLPALARPLEPLASRGALWLPPRHPGVLTVALQIADTLASLQADLVAALETAIAFQAERRRFRPHITVGRVARATRIDTRGELDPPAPRVCFAPRALTLYRSRTSPAGARYERLTGVELR